jgi:hypothetical protein
MVFLLRRCEFEKPRYAFFIGMFTKRLKTLFVKLKADSVVLKFEDFAETIVISLIQKRSNYLFVVD